MPTPKMEGLCQPPDEKISSQFLVELLDAKFAQQEQLIRKLIKDPVPEFPVETLDLQQLGAQTSRVEPLEVKEPVLEVCDLDFPEKFEEEEDEELKPQTASKGAGLRSGKLGVTVMKERWEPEPFWKVFVKGPLDGYMGIVVLINLAFMILETQSTGAHADFSLGLSPDAGWNIDENFFQVAEYIFFSMYSLDVLVRIIILRHEWYFDPRQGFMFLNVFDACVVAVNAFELLIMPLFVWGSDQDQVNSIRVIKLMRIARTLRIVKTVQLFRQLRLLVGTCVASIGALFWSMVLLMVLKVGFALVICQALQPVILDPTTEDVTRLEVNRLYGSFLKALYTMFEITHSGSWPAVVRPIVERVNAWYAVLFLTYITLVVFAVIRIVTALFLKETLASAAMDSDMVMEDNRRAALEAQMKLEELFRAADDDGDGHLSPEEFVEALSLPSVQGFLQSMDLSIRDTGPLFEILDDGDGLITITEFCKGLLQLKGMARALDIIVLQRENAKVLRECREMHAHLQTFFTLR